MVVAVHPLRSPQKAATHKAIPKPPIAPSARGKCTRLGHAKVSTLKDDPSLAPFNSPFEAQGKQGKRVGHAHTLEEKIPRAVQVRRAPWATKELIACCE
jgi:hypothetical protein